MGQIQLIIGAIALTIIAGLGATVWYLNGRVDTLIEQKAISETARVADRLTFDNAKAQLEESINTLKDRRRDDQIKILRLGDTNAALTAKSEDYSNRYNNMRNRIDRAATGRPNLVGRISTRAIGRVRKQFTEASTFSADTDGGGANTALPPAPTATNPGAERP